MSTTGKVIQNLTMHSFNTTLMGVLKGVADFFVMGISSAWLFGGSGHAFLINIHEQICPSGPYAWNYETFYRLVGNLGIKMTDLGFFHSKSTLEEQRRVEEVLRKSIDMGMPCSLLNMENQLIVGYDDKRFILKQPWPWLDLPITPKTLTFETWEELGDKTHVTFFSFDKTGRAGERTIVLDSLNAAVDMVENPENWGFEHYYVGLQAYDTWVKAVNEGFGPSHGNWWNGTVWSECREMASAYFAEIASRNQGTVSEIAEELSSEYGKIAKLLDKARSKELADDAKIETLQEARKAEESCIRQIKKLLSLM